MNEAQNNIVLSLNGLSVGYRSSGESNIVLEEINLDLPGGNLVCFMGPNGVGKSTLLKTIIGVLPPLSGNVVLNTKDLDSYSSAELAREISVVLTHRVNNVNLSVHELVSLGRYPHTGWLGGSSEQDDEKIEWAIRETHIGDLRDRKLYTLSDGQVQKSLIARALAQDGNLMILDEPNIHLDLNNRVEIMHLLKDLTRNTGKTVLMATHELDLALQMADKIWLAGFNGKIVSGIPEDLVLSDKLDSIFQTKGYNLKTGKVAHVKKDHPAIRITGSGYVLLWTRNALEREGYTIDDQSKIVVKVEEKGSGFQWNLENKTYETVADLLEGLNLLIT